MLIGEGNLRNKRKVKYNDKPVITTKKMFFALSHSSDRTPQCEYLQDLEYGLVENLRLRFYLLHLAPVPNGGILLMVDRW